MRICLICGEPIAPKRLAAVPATRYCLLCQDAQDLDPCESLDPQLLAAAMAESSDVNPHEWMVA